MLENHFVTEEVASAIEVFRLNLTPEKCQNYINKIHEVILSINRNNKKWLINTVFDLIKGFRNTVLSAFLTIHHPNPITSPYHRHPISLTSPTMVRDGREIGWGYQCSYSKR